MGEKKRELVEYVRVLYDRQSSRAAKAGMTSWAIAAGAVYLAWHIFDTLSEGVESQSFWHGVYTYFDNVFLSLFSIVLIIGLSAVGKERSYFDYRVRKKGVIRFGDVASIALFLSLPLSVLYFSSPPSDDGFQNLQRKINFWFLIVALTLIVMSFLIDSIKRKRSGFAPPENLLLDGSGLSKVYHVCVIFVLLLLLFGNLRCLWEPIGDADIIRSLVFSFDLTLLMMAVYGLLLVRQTGESLVKLERLERDIVIHNLEEKQILERLQDEMLGSYVGDWMESVVKDIRLKASHIVTLTEESAAIAEEISLIDPLYEMEREGRAKKYIDSLSLALNDYDEVLLPVLKWFKDAGLQSSIFKDSFVLSLIDMSLKEIEEGNAGLKERVSQALRTINSAFGDGEFEVSWKFKG